MASNAFGNLFRYTTWGESHGESVGVVVDGCPAGIVICEKEINLALKKRAPGNSPFTSPRKESDHAIILSGVFEGVSTGAPISITIKNKDGDSSHYEKMKDLLRPGHANYPYIEKYGCFDYRGGGRASARETVGRVAAGAIAQKLLDHFGIKISAYIKQIGSTKTSKVVKTERTYESPIYCPDKEAEEKMMAQLLTIQEEGDSIGGVVECQVTGVPVGLGDPIYNKVDALLAFAMMSLPASKGFEIGSGFEAAKTKGSLHNDLFSSEEGKIELKSNHSGGLLGGISIGEPLFFRVAFKPTSSIKKTQETVDKEGIPATLKFSKTSRHDPCVAIRAVPVVEAMTAVVLADLLLQNRCAKL